MNSLLTPPLPSFLGNPPHRPSAAFLPLALSHLSIISPEHLSQVKALKGKGLQPSSSLVSLSWCRRGPGAPSPVPGTRHGGASCPGAQWLRAPQVLVSFLLLTATHSRPTHSQRPLFYPKQITSHFLSQSAKKEPSWTGIKGIYTQPFLPPQRRPPPPPISRCR